MAPGLGNIIRLVAQMAIPMFRAVGQAYQQALHSASPPPPLLWTP